MNRYVLIYKGEGAKPDKDMNRLRDLPRTVIIDDSPSQMVLVKAPKAELKMFVNSLPQWDVSPVRTYAVPEVRPRLMRGARLSRNAKNRRKSVREGFSVGGDKLVSSE